MILSLYAANNPTDMAFPSAGIMCFKHWSSELQTVIFGILSSKVKSYIIVFMVLYSVHASTHTQAHIVYSFVPPSFYLSILIHLNTVYTHCDLHCLTTRSRSPDSVSRGRKSRIQVSLW